MAPPEEAVSPAEGATLMFLFVVENVFVTKKCNLMLPVSRARAGLQVKKKMLISKDDFLLSFLKVKVKIHHFGLDF